MSRTSGARNQQGKQGKELSPNMALGKIDVERMPSKLRWRQKAKLDKVVAWCMKDSESLANPRSIVDDVRDYYSKPRLSGKLLEPTRFEILEAEYEKEYKTEAARDAHKAQLPMPGAEGSGQIELGLPDSS